MVTPETPACDHPNLRGAPWATCDTCGARKDVSASEVKQARSCLRKWAGRYAGEWGKGEETEAKSNGTALHALHGRYLTGGTPPQVHEHMGDLALAGLGWLPAPGSGLVETRFTISIDGIPFVVIPDWCGPAHEMPGVGGIVAFGVHDHKTSKNPKKYGVWDKAAFLSDAQALIYDTLPLHLGLGEVDVYNRWLYHPTRGRGKVTPSDCVLTAREIRGGVERVVLPVAEKIYRLRDIREPLDPNSLEANPGACSEFGGCEYHPTKGGPCSVSTTDTMRTMMSGFSADDITDTQGEEMDAASLFGKLTAPQTMQTPVNGPPAPAPASQGAPQGGFNFGFGAPPALTQTAPAPAAATPPAPAPVAPPVQAPANGITIEHLRHCLHVIGAALEAAAAVLKAA